MLCSGKDGADGWTRPDLMHKDVCLHLPSTRFTALLRR